MNQYNQFKKEKYFPNYYLLNKITSPESEPTLKAILGGPAAKLLNLIIKNIHLKMKTPHQKGKHFYEGILFSTEYVKKETGLSYYKQQQALNVLKDFQLISTFEHQITEYQYVRCVTLTICNIGDFNRFFNKYKAGVSKSYSLIQLTHLYNDYIHKLLEAKFLSECEDYDIEEEEELL